MKDRKHLESGMDVLWNPRSVAMIGATNKLMKWGFIIFARMLTEGFEGEIYAVNPRDDEILGRKCYRSVLDIPGPVDLAIVVTPSPSVPDVIRRCAEKGARAAVVITSNFSEVGPEGAALEDEIVALARDAGMVLVGPNTMGICNSANNFNCLMGPVSPLPGTAACVAQSGNVGTHMLMAGVRRGLGFGKFASSGNEGLLRFEDYLWYFGRDPETRAVLGYLEGLGEGSDFIEVAREVTAKKPVVLLKGGRTGAGASAAASHTGAMAGDLAVIGGAMRQAGVILADTNKQVVDLGRALELLPLPRGRRVGILTRGGGWGVITSDACAEAGLQVAPLSKKTLSAIDKILPPYWSRGNPVDMVAVIEYKAFMDCLEILRDDPGVDSVIALGVNMDAQSEKIVESMRALGAMTEKEIAEFVRGHKAESDAFFDELRDFIAASDKPILTVGRGRDESDWKEGLMMIGEPENAAGLLGKMAEYGAYLRRRGLM